MKRLVKSDAKEKRIKTKVKMLDFKMHHSNCEIDQLKKFECDKLIKYARTELGWKMPVEQRLNFMCQLSKQLICVDRNGDVPPYVKSSEQIRFKALLK